MLISYTLESSSLLYILEYSEEYTMNLSEQSGDKELFFGTIYLKENMLKL